ncbi:hypothetical protein PSY31_23330, partial [Shigella flexneri]|nr:hypothetical protein [Shigella flexneri]
ATKEKGLSPNITICELGQNNVINPPLLSSNQNVVYEFDLITSHPPEKPEAKTCPGFGQR